MVGNSWHLYQIYVLCLNIKFLSMMLDHDHLYQYDLVRGHTLPYHKMYQINGAAHLQQKLCGTNFPQFIPFSKAQQHKKTMRASLREDLT